MDTTKVRSPAVAGTFYPSQPVHLRQTVRQFLESAVYLHVPPPKAIIVPHAGYLYSGPVAGTAYRHWLSDGQQIERLVLIGPAHWVPVFGIAATSFTAFATPLGEMVVDLEAVEKIRPFPYIHISNPAHIPEHCLEVQLPFLQEICPQARIVPLLVGDATPQQVAEILSVFWSDSHTRFIVSSDLSHYHTYETARRLDMATAMAIQRQRPNAIGPEQACGRLAIQGLLYLTEQSGMVVHIADLRNSGDTAGSKDQVVGYGAFLFTNPTKVDG
ncbi:MAG: AmmeMemoRadiSam system protein B [Chloroflexi bacterium]|nr:MAG: AmmeMemoRadiSam system protein B [Chloroflexota bacterium]